MPAHDLYTAFARAFPADAAAPFIVEPGGSVVHYGEVDERSASMAGALAGLGVARSDRVVVQLPKSPTAVLLYLACLRHGAVHVPLNPSYTVVETASLIADADPALVVTTPSRASELRASSVPVTVAIVDDDGHGDVTDRSDPATGAAQPISPDHVAAILYTSGTTGRPKGAMLTHHNLLANAEVLHAAWAWEPGDVLLHVLPLFHAHGLFVAMHAALLNGSKVILVPRFDAAQVVELLPQATVLMAVPTHYVRLLAQNGFDEAACRRIRLFTSGSAPLAAPTWEAVAARTGHQIVERYGTSETLMIASNPYHGDRVPGTVGFPLPGVQVRVVDEGGLEVPATTMGRLEVHGASVFAGYHRAPDATARAMRPGGWFDTGDLATVDTSGRVTIRGRARDVVISAGVNISPREVEEVLERVGGVAESAVVGVPHPDLGEALVAVVVPGAGELPTAEAMAKAWESSLARFKHPKAVVLVDALPRNTMGKVEKAALRHTLAEVFSGGRLPQEWRFLSQPPDTVPP
jgi:malonyl-CoA/methylmalonyl-CoA synthetase